MPPHQARFRNTNRMRDGFNFMNDLFRVAGHPFVFLFHDQPLVIARVVRCDPGRAGILVAFQRLNAAQREHEAARRGHEICARRQGPGQITGIDQLAAGNQPDAGFQPVGISQVGNQRQGFAYRHAHQIHQRHGRSASAAFTAIDCDKIGGVVLSMFGNGTEQVFQGHGATNHGLDADGFARHLPYMANDTQQIVEIRDVSMPVGRQAVLALLDPADRSNLGRDLGTGQNTALARLGTLRQLDFKHAHRVMICNGPQFFITQLAIGITHTILGRPNLIDNVATALEMEWAEPAFAGVQPDTRLFRAPAQRLDRRARQSAKAHPRDIKEGRRSIGFARARPDHQRFRTGKLVVQRRERRVHEYRRPCHAEISGGPKGHSIVMPLRGTVDPFPLGAVERQFFAVHRKEILTEKLPKRRKQISEPPDHRVISPDRIPRLQPIRDEKHHDQQRGNTNDCHEG